MKRDLISIDDLSDAEIAGLVRHAAGLEAGRGAKALDGSILATLFLEPSTRTRLSFEAAMHRLGGAVITSADAEKSSAAKGESLADTVRMVDSYADVIVLRHSAAGAARAAAGFAQAPVINAGDGGHEHPTQALVDLYALKREVGRLDGLRVALYGDLRYGRTAHSLVRALCRFGASVLALSEPGLELPESVLGRLRSQGARVGAGSLAGMEDLFRGREPSATAIEAGAAGVSTERPAFDAVYVTRLQRERLAAERGPSALPPVDARFLASPAFARAIVMHPLPRTSEIDPSIDSDPRAAYFRQAAGGVPVRMALLLWALGRIDAGGSGPPPHAVPESAARGSCEERTCISVREPATAPARRVRSPDGADRCAYCDTRWPAACGS